MRRSSKGSFTQNLLRFPFFLLLLGVYPVLFLLASNLGQAAPYAALQSLLFSVGVVVVVSAACLLTIRPASRAYLAAALLLAAFYAYGHLFNLIDGQAFNGFRYGRHSLFFPVFAALVLGLLLVILRRPAPRSSPAPALNFVLGGLVLVQLVSLVPYTLSARAADTQKVQVAGQSTAAADPNAPDIYYIIIDGLAREDYLREELGFSDYSLPQELAKRGFVIPDCALSNYGTTSLSVASTLNMQYVDALGVPDEWVNTTKDDPADLYNLLHANQVVSVLKQRGYAFVSFRGFFPLNDFKEADYYFNIYENQQGRDELAERNFHDMFIRTTLLRLPSEYLVGTPSTANRLPRFVLDLVAPDASVFSSRSYQWYQQHLYTFDKLETVPALPGKKFVYAHFYSTHQPYVFNPDGSLLWPLNENNDGYISAIRYTSGRILEVIDRILSESAQPPVIIVQADHGTGSGIDKHKILNAFYLPGGGEKNLYAGITPVNTFRVLLNQYTGQSYPLLPDTILLAEPNISQFRRMPAGCDLP